MEELESKCYDKFDFKLEDLQILIAKAGNGLGLHKILCN